MNPQDTIPHLNTLISYINHKTSELNNVNYKHIRGFNYPKLKDLLLPNSDSKLDIGALSILAGELTSSMNVIEKISTATDMIDALAEENKLLKILDSAVRNIFRVSVSIDENASLF